eukprot:7778321-Prorocentrum_lima.AAC.1
MTSSLVGSEMCIRDRSTCTISGSRTRSTAIITGSSSPFQQLPHGADPVSVSYTHLTLPTICSV